MCKPTNKLLLNTNYIVGWVHIHPVVFSVDTFEALRASTVVNSYRWCAASAIVWLIAILDLLEDNEKRLSAEQKKPKTLKFVGVCHIAKISNSN